LLSLSKGTQESQTLARFPTLSAPNNTSIRQLVDNWLRLVCRSTYVSHTHTFTYTPPHTNTHCTIREHHLMLSTSPVKPPAHAWLRIFYVCVCVCVCVVTSNPQRMRDNVFCWKGSRRRSILISDSACLASHILCVCMCVCVLVTLNPQRMPGFAYSVCVFACVCVCV